MQKTGIGKVVVCYLFTCFDHQENIEKFIKHYRKYKSGIDHNLLICFKMLKEKDILLIKNFLKKVNYRLFIDPVETNDFDFGSYKRVAQLHHDKLILFLNSHSYPICDDWLSILLNNNENNTLIGTSASNESLYNTIKLKKKYKFFSYFVKKFILKKKFYPFPNPHIRTSSFLIYGQLFLNYMIDKNLKSKENAWEIESGKKSLTNYFKQKKYPVYIINSDGEKFTETNWMYSETYCYSKQSKSIISDKHTRKYLSLSEKDRTLSQIKVWGQ
tara:strand:- start:49 stop:864 length:816 start_codon:yes stop_codon:yes gene_type:complete